MEVFVHAFQQRTGELLLSILVAPLPPTLSSPSEHSLLLSLLQVPADYQRAVEAIDFLPTLVARAPAPCPALEPTLSPDANPTSLQTPRATPCRTPAPPLVSPPRVDRRPASERRVFSIPGLSAENAAATSGRGGVGKIDERVPPSKGLEAEAANIPTPRCCRLGRRGR